MNRKFKFETGEFYHVYNRGTDKRIIFVDDADYKRFIKLLFICNSDQSVHLSNIEYQGRTLINLVNNGRGESLVDIGAYCLMPNHFHMILHEKVDGGISSFMKKLLTAYSMYFNNKHERTGSLFEGKFKAIHVNTDDYLEYLFAYIHLNPVKLIELNWKEGEVINTEEAKKFLESYKYSSYFDYVGKIREELCLINKVPYPEYFSTPKEHRDFVEYWLKNEDIIKVRP